MPRSVSPADAALIAAAAELGVRVSGTQLERWRTRGLLARNERQYTGRGTGSRSTVPPGALERVVQLGAASRQGRALPEAVTTSPPDLPLRHSG